MRRPPVKKWMHGFHVPVVKPGRIVFAPCPAYDVQVSCYNPDTDTLYLLPNASRAEFAHELGHVFDCKVIQPVQRALLKKRYRIPDQRVMADDGTSSYITPGWFWGDMPQGPMEEGPEAGCEIFADLYMDVATGSRWFRRPWFKRFIKKAYKEYRDRRPN